MNVAGQFILPAQPEEMKVVSVIDNLHLRIILNIIHIFGSNMRTVQVCVVYLVPICLKPVPDTGRIIIPVQHFNAHLLERGGVRFFMEEVVSQEFNHITFFQEHFQVLVCGLGTGVLIKRGHVVVHHQDDFLSLAALPCPKWVGAARVDTLAFQFLRPFFLKLPAVFHLVALQAGAVYIRAVGHSLKMDYL